MREQLFSYLPYPLKMAGASVEALRLRAWRYGHRFEEQVAAADERDSWSHDQWRSWQQRRVESVLSRAIASIPLYREAWAELRKSGAAASPQQLSDWPVLTKASIRSEPQALRGPDLPKRLFHEHTSGSTGTPLTLLFTRRALQDYYAIYEHRIRRWNDVDRASRWAILGGRLVARVGRNQPPYWVWNPISNQLYLSSYHLSRQTVQAYASALAQHEVEYIIGYPSAIYTLCRLALDSGVRLPELKVSIANAEPVFDHQRVTIEAALRAPLRATYGMSEMVLAASECQSGTMHLWPEVGLLEILDAEGKPAPDGTRGRVVATSLLNSDTPLIRYDTGDCMVASSSSEPCACGRPLYHLGSVEGRLDDVIVCPDGRHVGRLDPVFKADLPIVEAQIVQTSSTRLVMRVVPAQGFTDDVGHTLRERLRDRVGEMDIAVERVDHIPRTAAGKFRAVVGLRS